MAKSGEFYTFDEVVRQLKIDQNKLKLKLVDSRTFSGGVIGLIYEPEKAK